MALLRQLVSRKGLPIKPALLYNSSRSAARVLSDYMPGPYPKTEKERLEAAKKYGLLPEEYEPTPDDGWGRGDYPRLPEIGADSKDPWYPWDLPEYRKNFGEVWHIDSDMLGEDRVDPQKDWWVDKRVMMGMLVGVIGTFWTIAMLTDPYPVHRPVSAKQIPGKESGKVYYTFEKSN